MREASDFHMTSIFGNIPYISKYRLTSLPSLDNVVARSKKIASKVPFADDVIALYFCAVDRKVPLKIKASIIASLAYLVLPVDAVPDFLLGLGFTDDVAVMTALYSLVSGHITDEHRRLARRALDTPEATEAVVEEA
jgi:uncharacterized membrane protein YkvA (DUF1232 family)